MSTPPITAVEAIRNTGLSEYNNVVKAGYRPILKTLQVYGLNQVYVLRR